MNQIRDFLMRIGILFFVLLFGSHAFAGIIYTNDFEGSTLGSEWSSGGLTTSSDGSPATQYHGNFNTTGSTTLTLTGLSAHSQVLLDFDLYLFSTWDGEGSYCCGKDHFSLSGDVTFDETFSNHQVQSYAGTADECYIGSTAVSCTSPNSTRTDIYRSLGPTGADTGFLFAHSGSTLTITFAGPTTQTDEWWGIDNISISTNDTSVPEPAGIALLGLGLLGIGLGRRRRGASTAAG